ncbi:2-amino-4-hydroxy-6-hydroxymethyldihydropteridine diphosphokinase [Clostridium sp. 'White wine YQ']|uniref:2-amino-4-hydroxy-6- hydroxymethyldihydropteridine diphosphokinase n=1 Tax=Clostridium sp. 'White wine YQ' TaxID=3027474 RepID=UPI0023665EBF|nr:2-amino-4-hydroxy-6-hydroxymethyldihydropteridine diphosphokinase [Clostridium sp. 'White wine YQ']MDD7793041.1 2-amino-4-hydroxy-6-hydroxymethyldihydropteridine diphosphokinase [Clostridium sp. 'White wine YQ']
MDKLYVRDLEVFAFHGVFEEEKKLGQKFLISLELSLDLKTPGRTGDLTASVHYGELSQRVEQEFNKISYDLIETACNKISEFVLINYPLVKEIKVSVKKPWAPIHRNLDTVEVEITRKRSRAVLSLGSNLGDKEENLKKAIEIIDEHDLCKVLKTSSFIKTEPWGYTEQEEFLNCAIEIETMLSPSELMDFLLHIEQKLKRERVIKWGPRTLDIDIIFMDEIVSNDEHVILPHPRMHQRLFVLEPVNEICPFYLHPLMNKRVFELLEIAKETP